MVFGTHKVLSLMILSFVYTVTIYHSVMKREYLLLLALARISVQITLERSIQYLLEKISKSSKGFSFLDFSHL